MIQHLYLLLLAVAQVPVSDDGWRYTVRRPAEGWQQPQFDDSAWRESNGGFGTPDTPGARVGTMWDTNSIWLRRQVILEAVPEQAALLIHHDEDARVFLNGKQVAHLRGYVTDYQVVPLDSAAKAVLRAGPNTLAVHCRQTGGGQFIDVHLVDAGNVPTLPPAKRSTVPFQSDLITKWGADVTPENAWQEYPRPQLVRDRWQNLNGHWDYVVTEEELVEPPTAWSGKILVPFSIESRLGGVQRLLNPNEALWYRRQVRLETEPNRRTLLNFEAVDYACRVWVNGKDVGSHVGGNLPFTLDITEAATDGTNEIVVRVQDATGGTQLRGKQTLTPRGIWYTQVSGIWQTVWIEQVPRQYLEDLQITTRAEDGTISLHPKVAGNDDQPLHLRVTVRDGDEVVAEETVMGNTVQLQIEGAKLWSPTSPHLYSLSVALLDGDTVLDQVESYAGIRDVGQTRDDNGHLRFTLNGKTIFHWGPLDQGWWPDGLLTPPSDEAMLFEIDYLKSAGFNMIRKHIKIEPRRYYYHCDRMGMMVWQDHVSGGPNPPWTRLQPDPQDADWPDDAHAQFMRELDTMIDVLDDSPSIVVWVPFNEAWGQHRTVAVGEWTVERDPSRLINIASGGNFWPVGHIVDAHSYPEPAFPFDSNRYRDFVKVMGEFGGHGWPVQGHLWDSSRRNWGYGNLLQSLDELKQRYRNSIQTLAQLKDQGIAGGVYTQTTDVEGEINGLLTYDRKVAKLTAEELKKIHDLLFE